MPLSVGARLGPYSVTAKIGEGGMGEVYPARDIADPRGSKFLLGSCGAGVAQALDRRRCEPILPVSARVRTEPRSPAPIPKGAL